ncbi:MAG: hypothetical protein NZ898_04980 [Myxococcota bacterium]|nr:hypothetical protein [Myxococcota bacterium]MDW8362881.1 hypothetical protein [Myxococcales bacterium]
MIRLALLAAACSGCGGSPAPTASTPRVRVPEPSRVVLPVIHVDVPASGVLRLALAIDVGSRHAEPPAIATLAAFVAESRVANAVRARVLPDATVFEVDCDPATVDSCLEPLAGLFATRRVEEPEMAAAFERLLERRRRASADPARALDALALRALFGDSAAGLEPLGHADDDGRLHRGSVDAFLEAHYGPARAALFVAGRPGDAWSRLRAWAGQVVAALPAARASRPAPREVQPRHGRVHRVAADGEGAFSVAWWCGSLSRAAFVLEHLRRMHAVGIWHPARVHGSAFALEGGAVGLLHARGARGVDALQRAAFEIERALRRSGEVIPGPSTDVDVALARAVAQWSARAGPTSDVPAPAWGAALSERVEGEGERDRAPTIAARVRSAFEARVRGIADSRVASLVIGDGARVEVRNRSSQRGAIAVLFAGGARLDVPSEEGRAAVAARALAAGCDEVLAELGWSAYGHVEADAWGLIAEGPETGDDHALEAALACATQGTPLAERVEHARRAWFSERRTHADLAFETQLARVLVPGAPGIVATGGTLDGIGRLEPHGVTAFLEDARVAERTVVAVFASRPADRLATSIVPRLASLRRGAMPAERDPGPLAPPLTWIPSTRGHVLASLRADMRGVAHGPAAWAVGAAVAQALARGGDEVLWHGGAASGRTAWAAVAFVPFDGVASAAIPGRLQDAMRQGRLAWQDVLRRRRRLDAWAEASPAWAALALARRRLGLDPTDRGSGPTARALLEAVPRFVVASPR